MIIESFQRDLFKNESQNSPGTPGNQMTFIHFTQETINGLFPCGRLDKNKKIKLNSYINPTKMIGWDVSSFFPIFFVFYIFLLLRSTPYIFVVFYYQFSFQITLKLLVTEVLCGGW